MLHKKKRNRNDTTQILSREIMYTVYHGPHGWREWNLFLVPFMYFVFALFDRILNYFFPSFFFVTIIALYTHRISHISIKLCLCWHKWWMLCINFHSWAHIFLKRCEIWEYGHTLNSRQTTPNARW